MIVWVRRKDRKQISCTHCGAGMPAGSWFWLALHGRTCVACFCNDCERFRWASERELLQGRR